MHQKLSHNKILNLIQSTFKIHTRIFIDLLIIRKFGTFF